MKDKVSLYKPLNFFMLRTPVFTSEFFDSIKFSDEEGSMFNDSLFQKIIPLAENPIIREAVNVASTSLINAIDKLKNEKDIKKKEQTILNFLKYLIRMSTRPTPFGLFSGVTSGDVTDLTKIYIRPEDHYTKNTRPDMEWLLSAVKKIESDVKNVRQLKVSTNTLADFSGERIYLPYNTQYGKKSDENDMLGVSIRFTEAVKFVFDNAMIPIKYDDLLNLLINKYSSENKTVIINFLWQLFESEYLISELRPPLMVSSPFNYILEVLTSISGLEIEKNTLTKIKELIAQYDITKIGEGKPVYDDIITHMKSLHQSPNYLQVDLLTKKLNCSLGKHITDEISQVAELLWRLSPEYVSKPEYMEYRNDFIEKYGIYREIPILELLDPDRGLGSPAGYNMPESRRRINYTTPTSIRNMERFLLDEITKNKSIPEEIELTDEIIAKVEPVAPNYNTAPVSMELFFTINAPSQEALNNHDYTINLSPNTGSSGAGKTFGRFIHFLDGDCKKKVMEINELEKEFFENTVFAEIVYMPDSGRSSNICISENYRDYEIVIFTSSSRSMKKTLALSDLLVGTTYDSFYIKSKSLNKRVIITTGHMLNLVGVPNIYRFLREISLDGTRSCSQLLKGSINDLPFVPRIRYKKTILSPAVWNLSWNSFTADRDKIKADPELFINEMKKWRKNNNVPRYVYLTELDNKILLDLESEIHLRLLYSETPKLNRYTALSLIEAEKNSWIKSDNGTYIGEFVLPLIKNKTFIERFNQNELSQENSNNTNFNNAIKNRLVINKPNPFAEDIRYKYPGSDWLFVKLYGNSKREDEFIGYSLRNICNSIMADKYAEKYFFMRYADPESHIRLRFKGKPVILTNNILPELYKFATSLKKEGLLSKFVIDTYEREVERYGGPELIDYTEDIFYFDSVIVEQLLYMTKTKTLNFDFEMLIVISIIDYLESFGLEFEDQLRFLDSLVDYTQYLDDFRTSRKIYMKIANSANDWEGLRNHDDGLIIKNLLAKRHIVIKRFVQKLTMLQNKNRLHNSKDDIMASIIHLHCNRILGINRVYERKLMTLARHALHNLKYFKQKNNLIQIQQTVKKEGVLL